MAVTAGTGGTGSVDTTGGQIFDASNGAVTSLQVWCTDDSSAAVRVEVTGMHVATEGLYLPIGKTTIVRLGATNLQTVTCKSASSGADATIAWGVVALVGAAPM